jgi:photosystem II stability/assembly factor-like uncharacterized protein
MKRMSFLLLLLLLVSSINSQSINPDILNDLRARNIGPGGMSGRVTAIDVEPSNPAVIYVGTASGGIWKTTNGGINFDPIFDSSAVAGIGAIAVDPNNPDVVWAGTGEGNPRNSVTGGYGLYKSLDAGRTWNLIGLEKTRHIHRIIIHPTNSDVLYIGAIGSPWGSHKERGVYKTVDGGKSWDLILHSNELSGVADMIIDPQNPDKLFVAMWEHIRHPWFFKSGGKGSGLYMTIDAGENWTQLNEKSGLPKGELGRIGLAISASNPDYVYALIESKKNAVYRSTDGGYSWSKRGEKNIGDRPFYYADIFVDPTNENRLYSLYSRVNVSEDGGMTFRTLVGRNIHSDHHSWWIDKNDPSFMIDGNDGGLAITRDMGKNWRHVTNLPVSQFYHISVDNQTPYNVYGGMQDNGSWKGPGYVWSRDGIINEYWDFLMGGDGFDVLPTPDDPNACYAMSQQGYVNRLNTETGSSVSIRPVKTGADDLRFHWNAAIAQDPFDNSTIYFGSQFVHKSTDRGDSWETISPDLTTNDSSRQKFGSSGGLTYDVTGAETYTCILAISPSPLLENTIWVGTDDGNVQLTMDGGEYWENVTGKIKGLPDTPWIPQIIASKHMVGEAFVVVNNYRQNDYAPYLYRTENFGKSWKRMVDETDVEGYVLSFIQDPVQQNLMFLGTEYGLYVSINRGEDWVKWTNGYPTVSTMDMAIQATEADLVIGTFGRSAYVIDDIRPLRKWAEMGGDFVEQTAIMFEPPVAYMASSKNAPGYYFHGDAYFKAENRKMGAMLSFYVKDAKKENDKATAADSATIMILDLEGEGLRTMKIVPDRGINRVYWRFDKKGVSLDIGKKKAKNSGESGGGGMVLAGDYQVRLSYKGDSSEVKLTVKSDPRIEYDRDGLKERMKMITNTRVEIESFNMEMDKFRDCRTTLETIQKLSKEQAGDTLKTATKEIDKKLKALEKDIFGGEEVQGIFRDKNSFRTKIGPMLYLGYSNQALTPNQMVGVEKALEELNLMEVRIQDFLEKEWKSFRILVEYQDLSLFGGK